MPHTLIPNAFLALRLVLVYTLYDALIRPRIPFNRVSSRFLRTSAAALLHAAIIYAAIADWSNYWIPAFVLPLVIIAEIREHKSSMRGFALQQILYILILTTAWWIASEPRFTEAVQAIESLVLTPACLTVALGYALAIWPVGTLTGLFTAPWRQVIGADNSKGLANAGLWIGRLERVLIVTAILLNQFALIGFLVAAKSILRFSDIKTGRTRQEVEYILVGTLFSFTAAIIIGIATRSTLTWFASLTGG